MEEYLDALKKAFKNWTEKGPGEEEQSGSNRACVSDDESSRRDTRRYPRQRESYRAEDSTPLQAANDQAQTERAGAERQAADIDSLKQAIEMWKLSDLDAAKDSEKVRHSDKTRQDQTKRRPIRVAGQGSVERRLEARQTRQSQRRLRRDTTEVRKRTTSPDPGHEQVIAIRNRTDARLKLIEQKLQSLYLEVVKPQV